MIIDAHHHLWNGPLPWMTQPDFDPIRRAYSSDDLQREAEPAGVQKTILVQAIGEARETTDLLRIAVSNTDMIAGVVGWLDLEAPDVTTRLEHLQSSEGGECLVGIRHQAQGEPNSQWLTQPHVVRAVAAVADAGLVYDILVKGSAQMDAAGELAEQVPNGSFVLDHLGKPNIAEARMQPWADQISRLADNANVVAKLSGLVTEAKWQAWSADQIAPFVEYALQTFGPERLMWGSDWPVCTLAATYQSMLELVREITPTSFHAEIFAGTASRIYARAGLTL